MGLDQTTSLKSEIRNPKSDTSPKLEIRNGSNGCGLSGGISRRKAVRLGIVGAAAGSLFVFKGVYRAVLINYPNRAEKDELIAQARAGG